MWYFNFLFTSYFLRGWRFESFKWYGIFYFFLYPIFVSNILELVRTFCFIFKGPLEYPYIPNVGNFDIDGYLKGMNLRSWEILYWALDQSIPSSSTPSPICCYCCFCCKLRHQKMNLHNQWVNNGDIALP